MSVIYITTTYVNSAGRGILSIYLMHLMGPTETGMLAAKMAPYLFLSLFITSFSAECYIRGSRHKISGYRDRVASLLIDTLLLAGGLVFFLIQYSSTQLSYINILLYFILIFAAFGQISFNNLVDHKAWYYIAIANVSEVVLHIVLLTLWFKNDPIYQFILISFSRWFIINILNTAYVFSKDGILFKSVIMRIIICLKNISWIIRVIKANHIFNLFLKTSWTTFDVYLVNSFWSANEAGNYRFIKSLGILPSLFFGPIWTTRRQQIKNDFLQRRNILKSGYSTVIRLSAILSLMLVPTIFIMWLMQAQLASIINFTFAFNWLNVSSFSIWWLVSSCFGWIRYFMIATDSLTIGSFQSGFIILSMLLACIGNTFVKPELIFPAIVLISNLVFLSLINRPHE
jgi:hypothetical protein